MAAAVYLHSNYEPCKGGRQKASLGLLFPGLGTAVGAAAHQLNASCHQQGVTRHGFHCTVTSWGTLKLIQQLLVADTEQDLLQTVIFCRAFAEGQDKFSSGNS